MRQVLHVMLSGQLLCETRDERHDHLSSGDTVTVLDELVPALAKAKAWDEEALA